MLKDGPYEAVFSHTQFYNSTHLLFFSCLHTLHDANNRIPASKIRRHSFSSKNIDLKKKVEKIDFRGARH